ncbi:IS1634 family transposase [Nonomuraea monospora]|uniref:IS1634 family transposase n=1 Tax=Nonomuraea monospora TaxID=568818 RepID=A0ABP5PK61_9ACTN
MSEFVLQRRLGALPVIAEFCRRLDIAGVVDRACPVRSDAYLTHGQVIEALVANRLTSPAPLWKVEDWARDWAVEEVFGVDPGALNDDRIARALDAIAPELEQITGSIGAQAISAFGLSVAQMHWDMTSISLFGAFEQAEPEYPAPKYGHPKDRRTDLKQVQAGIAVTRDEGIPLFHRAYDGGAGEVSQVVQAMHGLQQIAGRREMLLIGDSKLISYGNVSAMREAGVTFIAPLAAAKVPAALFAGLDPAGGRLVEFVAARDAGKPAERRAAYHVIEDVMVLTAPKKTNKTCGAPITVRRILVHSTAHAQGQAAARALKLAKARDELDRLVRTAGSRYHPAAADVSRRAEEIARKRRVTGYLTTTVTTCPATGKPVFTWAFDQRTIDTDASADGWYALLTTLPPEQADAAEVLIRYKGQPVVERRYGDIKGPLAIAPMFLKHNRRITALISVICLALLVFCLIERQVRNALLPGTRLLFHPGNSPDRPTARLIFTALERIRLIPATATSPPQILIPDLLQHRLLALLDVDPTRPRWLTL